MLVPLQKMAHRENNGGTKVNPIDKQYYASLLLGARSISDIAKVYRETNLHYSEVLREARLRIKEPKFPDDLDEEVC